MVLKVFRAIENTGVARDYPTLRVGVVEIPSGHPLIRKLPKSKSPEVWEKFVKSMRGHDSKITLHELEVAAHNFNELHPGMQISGDVLEKMQHSHGIIHPPRGEYPAYGAW